MTKIYLSLAFAVGITALFGWQRFQIAQRNETIKEQKITIQNLHQKLFLEKNRVKSRCFEDEMDDMAKFYLKEKDENSSDENSTFDEFNSTIIF